MWRVITRNNIRKIEGLSRCNEDRQMKPIAEQTILITGATDGLGKATALALAKLGARVLIHGVTKAV